MRSEKRGDFCLKDTLELHDKITDKNLTSHFYFLISKSYSLLILFTQYAICFFIFSFLVFAGLIKSASSTISLLGSMDLNFSRASPLPPAWHTKSAIFLPVIPASEIKVFIGAAGEDAQTGAPMIIRS